MSVTLTSARQMADTPDAVIVDRVLAGDRDAYAGLVHRHQDAIYRHARGMGLDHDTSLDLVQEAFIRAFDRLADCRDGDSYRAWLFRICRNLCLDQFRNVRRLSIPMSALDDADRIEDPRGMPDELALTLFGALERLPVAMREAFLLKHDAGYTYEEIAELTSASPSAVKMRVHRAREALRAFLARHETDDVAEAERGSDDPARAARLHGEEARKGRDALGVASGTSRPPTRRMS